MRPVKSKSADIKNGRRTLKNDLIFIFGILAVILFGAAVLILSSPPGDTVTVTADGKHYGSYPLDSDITVGIRTGDDQSGLNVLVIENGKAYVEKASCPDGICSAHSPIHRNGESIICLPNKVVITVISEEKQSPDIIS